MQPVICPRGAAMTPSVSRRTASPQRQVSAAHASSTRSLTLCGPDGKRPVVFSRYHSSLLRESIHAAGWDTHRRG